MEKEMNFFDLCVACGRAIGRGCKAFIELLARMCRLSYRYWWLTLVFVLMGLAAAMYYSRRDNMIFRMDAVAMLNGSSIQQFEQAFAPIRTSQMLPEEAAIKPFIDSLKATHFKTYRVIDCLDDGVADYIDFKGSSSPTDTVKVQMQDRLCIAFRVKMRNLDKVPQIEQALLDYLNANAALQQSYKTYLANLSEEAAFNHRQALKLDSLTSNYYFYHPSNAQPMNYNGNGVNFYGDRRIRLFLEEIYEQQEHMQMVDYKLQLATAPIVLENHFAINGTPLNGRIKCLIVFALLAWIMACAIAALIEQRKTICAWLKK